MIMKWRSRMSLRMSRSNNPTTQSTRSQSISSSPNGINDDLSYKYIDSGNRLRLEKFGRHYVIRSCVSATWPKNSNIPEWNSKDTLKYTGISGQPGTWTGFEALEGPIENYTWTVQFDDHMVFNLRASEQGQVGVFPEQQENWKWITKMCAEYVASSSKSKKGSLTSDVAASSKLFSNTTISATATNTIEANRNETQLPSLMRVINGFAYTGGSTLAALRSPQVEAVHFDAAKSVVQVACKNAFSSQLLNRPCRWLVDDCFRFLDREIRRKSRYHGLIFDPPAFGRASKHSPQGWKLSNDLPELVMRLPRLLAPDAKFVLLSCHDPAWTPEQLQDLLKAQLPSGGIFETGEMTLKSCYTEGPLKGNKLPLGIYCRWYRPSK